VLGHVADTFLNKGYIREDPFELSPAELVQIDEQVKKLVEETLTESSKDVNHQFSSSVSKEQSVLKAQEKEHEDPATVLASLQEEVRTLEANQQEHESRIRDHLIKNENLASTLAVEAKPDYVTPELLETDATTTRTGAFLNLAKRAVGGVKRFFGGRGAAKKAASVAERVQQQLSGNLDKFEGQRYEDCMACRFIWKQVEMDVSNAKYIEDVQASFEHNCLDAQKSTVFYKACEDMYDDMYAMTDDYMSSDYTVDKMCQRANMCKP